MKFRSYLRNSFRELPGEVEQSPSCVCVRNRRDCAALLPLHLPVARLCIFHQICRSIEERRMDLTCLCVVRCRPCSKLSCNSMEHYGTRFQNLQACGINPRCRLYLHRSRRTWRERRDCMVAQRKMSVTCLFSLNKLIDCFTVL